MVLEILSFVPATFETDLLLPLEISLFDVFVNHRDLGLGVAYVPNPPPLALIHKDPLINIAFFEPGDLFTDDYTSNQWYFLCDKLTFIDPGEECECYFCVKEQGDIPASDTAYTYYWSDEYHPSYAPRQLIHYHLNH